MWIHTATDDGQLVHINLAQVRQIDYTYADDLSIATATLHFPNGDKANFSSQQAARHIFMTIEKASGRGE